MGKDKHKYIRVGTDYFKVIQKLDRFGIVRDVLKPWKKDEIKMDHGGIDYLRNSVDQYDDFVLVPDNVSFSPEINNCYNMYSAFPHIPKAGEWHWTDQLLKHIFGDQLEMGLTYMQVLYLFPKQALPILVLMSKERQTGKSTFLDWLNILFGANMAMIEPETVGKDFNGEYAGCNIIGIDETLIEKSIAVEKIKSLATKKFIMVNMKWVSQFKLEFFGKIVMGTNNEDKFIKVDDEEIRFWVRKLALPTGPHDILTRLTEEIPSFLHHLTTLPAPDFSKSRMVFTADELSNEWLDNVKKESKTWLYKDLTERFTNYFLNDDQGKHKSSAELLPLHIKESWFKHDNSVKTDFIIKVLRDEFRLKPFGVTNERKRFDHFITGISVTGRPYKIDRDLFTDPETTIDDDDATPDF